MKYNLILLLLFLFNISLSQNLVLNPSFEQKESIPKNKGEIEKATNCYNPRTEKNKNSPSPDFFHKKGKNGVGLTRTWVGKVKPFDGNSIGGVIVYSENSEFREYITMKIKPMQKDSIYDVSFHITNGFKKLKSKYFINEVGIYFSETKPEQKNNDHLNIIPQCKFSIDSLLTKWTSLSTTFIAEKKYSYITIGNFKNNRKTKQTKFNKESKFNFAYYFIDMISIKLARKSIKKTYMPNKSLPDTIQIANAISSFSFTNNTKAFADSLKQFAGKHDSLIINLLINKTDSFLQKPGHSNIDTINKVVEKLDILSDELNYPQIKQKSKKLYNLLMGLRENANITFCSDNSGSMKKGFGILKNGIINFLTNNPVNNDVISFIVCDEKATCLFDGANTINQEQITKLGKYKQFTTYYSFLKGLQKAININKKHNITDGANRIIFCIDYQIVDDYEKKDSVSIIQMIDSINSDKNNLHITLWYFESPQNTWKKMKVLADKFGKENVVKITEQTIDNELKKLVNNNTIVMKDIEVIKDKITTTIKFKLNTFNNNALLYFRDNNIKTTIQSSSYYHFDNEDRFLFIPKLVKSNKYQWTYEINLNICDYDESLVYDELIFKDIKDIKCKFKNGKIIIKTKSKKFIDSKSGVKNNDEFYIEFIKK